MVLRKVQGRRREEDIFPTLYRCNSVRTLRRAFARHGFERVVITPYDAEPSYLNFSMVAYWLGTLHQKYAPQCVRPSLFAFAERA